MLRAGHLVMPVSANYQGTATRDGRTANIALARGGVILPHLALTAYVLDRWTDGFHDPTDGTRLGLLANTRIAGIAARGEAVYLVNRPRAGLESATVTLRRR